MTTSLGRLITALDDLERTASRCLMLYSGGLDSSYFVLWGARSRLAIDAISVDLGGGEPCDPDQAHILHEAGISLTTKDASIQFAQEFITPAIRANALHQGLFPISSSLSRPLLAALAVAHAREINADCIVHTAGIHQNSFSRFNMSIRALAPDLHIAVPFLQDYQPREAKLRALAQRSSVAREIYSVDANVWARVIENGELDDVGNHVPEHVFAWTADSADAPADTIETTLTFEEGVPVALDGQQTSLLDIIKHLNRIAGQYGIGRFNGVEGTRFGLKNHEVREAPAAAVILSAHRHLEQLVLTDRELQLKTVLDREWTDLAVLGHWYGVQHAALDAYQRCIAATVQGDVTVALKPGYAFVTAINSENGLQEHNNPTSIVGARDLTFARGFELETVDLAVRRKSIHDLS